MFVKCIPICPKCNVEMKCVAGWESVRIYECPKCKFTIKIIKKTIIPWDRTDV